MSDTLTIPAPVGYPGEECGVENYMCRPPRWERGEIRAVRFTPAYVLSVDGKPYHVECQWIYEVFVGRPLRERPHGRPLGGGYVLTVSGGRVRRRP